MNKYFVKCRIQHTNDSWVKHIIIKAENIRSAWKKFFAWWELEEKEFGLSIINLTECNIKKVIIAKEIE